MMRGAKGVIRVKGRKEVIKMRRRYGRRRGRRFGRRRRGVRRMRIGYRF